MILEKHSTIQLGINFDLPELLKKPPKFHVSFCFLLGKIGIKHIGGDMFDYIPKGDAIFMKWVLTTWTDDECKQMGRRVVK
ncbi:hypothetical protein HAX54_005063 [Datura stramonium]|uniref:O-methyltransferase C-terminal domain-containing protein n=1 Tax=Datura stramonium TaxID=4076 RepID=A0ABS8WVR8_DATST|nr:hypothetical protein [Datura stramonium]